MTRQPSFLENILLALEVSPVQVVAGPRIADRFMVGGHARSLNSAMAAAVGSRLDTILVYDPLNCSVRHLTGLPVPWISLGDGAAVTKTLEEILGKTPDESEVSTLLVVEDGDFLFDAPSGRLSVLHHLDRLCEKAGKTPQGKSILSVLIKFRNACKVPALITANPLIRQTAIGPAGRDERAAFASLAVEGMTGFLKSGEAVEKLAAVSENMLLEELNSVVDLCARKASSLSDIEHIARGIRIGAADSPWAGVNLRAALLRAEELIRRRVKGQSHVVAPVIRALKRAALNLSGAHSAQAQAPRLVLWLSGPTGTGKTELAKTLAELIFGDENAIVRFDCAEFADAHSDARLIGSPPGYVGHESGGELTGAVWARPFSVILLDEIEKAHPRILDKFLAILDDGRLSDGQGRTVNFSETVLVFSSNLGMADSATGKGYTLDTPFTDLEEGVRSAVEDHFVRNLGRPELLGRIGRENIFVFDFIRKDIAGEILGKMMEKVLVRVEENTGIRLTLSDEAVHELRHLCLGEDVLKLGGRGVAKKLEAVFTTRLSDLLFDLIENPCRSYRIGSITAMEMTPA